MKKMKFNFAGIVAFVAVLGVVAVQARVFDGRPARIADCFRPPFSVRTICGSLTRIIDVGDACDEVKVGDHIYSLSNVVIDAINCNGGQFICCVRVEVDSSPCLIQPIIDPVGGLPADKYRVSDVFCKSTAN